MKNEFIILLISVASAQFLQLSDGSSLGSLKEISNIDYSKLDCNCNLAQISAQVSSWARIMKDIDVIDREVVLMQRAVQRIHNAQNKLDYHKIVERQGEKILSELNKRTSSEDLPYYKWRHEEANGLKGHLNMLHQAATNQEATECCKRIEDMINKYLDERKEARKECKGGNITVNIIDGDEKTVHILKNECNKQDHHHDEPVLKKQEHVVEVKKEEPKPLPIASKPATPIPVPVPAPKPIATKPPTPVPVPVPAPKPIATKPATPVPVPVPAPKPIATKPPTPVPVPVPVPAKAPEPVKEASVVKKEEVKVTQTQTKEVAKTVVTEAPAEDDEELVFESEAGVASAAGAKGF